MAEDQRQFVPADQLPECRSERKCTKNSFPYSRRRRASQRMQAHVIVFGTRRSSQMFRSPQVARLRGLGGFINFDMLETPGLHGREARDA